MELTEELIGKFKDTSTPFLIIDKGIIKRNYERIKKNFNRDIEIFYSVKANDNPEVLKTLAKIGSSFDVASFGEIEKIKNLVPPEKIAFSSPVKGLGDIKKAYDSGVELFAFDSLSELEKLSSLAPKSKVYLRLLVDNHGSHWPLNDKFGASASEAVSLLIKSRELNLIPYGLTFHVGSQCLRVENWRSALKVCHEVWQESKKKDINLQMLNLGGGIPVRNIKDVPSIEEISSVVNKSLEELFANNVRLVIEPGRSIIGDAAILVTTVIGKTKRNDKNWLYLDCGVFNGLMEAYEKFKYEVRAGNEQIFDNNKKKFTLFGPTCENLDKIADDVLLPDLDIGDRLYIINAGAYTISYQDYNGFKFPEAVFNENT